MPSGNTTYKNYFKPPAGQKPWYNDYWTFLDSLDLDIHNIEQDIIDVQADFTALEGDFATLQGSFDDHSARHEVGGADVISLTDLEGDSIKVDQIDEKTLGAGINIDGLLLKDGYISNLLYPSSSDHAANKQYVDDMISSVSTGISWRGVVIDKDLTVPPGAPSTGDRYIVGVGATGAWAGHDNEITEWNGAMWVFNAPDEGWTLYVDDENTYYTFDGAAWQKMGSYFSHNSMAAIQGGAAGGGGEYYHFTQTEHTDLVAFQSDPGAQLGELNDAGSPQFADIATGQIANISAAPLDIVSDHNLTFDDQYLAAAIGLSEAGEAGLDVWFSAVSIVGALNELATDKRSEGADVLMTEDVIYLDTAQTHSIYFDGTYAIFESDDMWLSGDIIADDRGIYMYSSGLDLYFRDSVSGDGGSIGIAETNVTITSDFLLKLFSYQTTGSTGIEFRVEGGGDFEFTVNNINSELIFVDGRMWNVSKTLHLTEAGEVQLDAWFSNASLVGALNELALGKLDIDYYNVDIAPTLWFYPTVNPAPLDTDTGTNGSIKRNRFDSGTEEFVEYIIKVPDNLDTSGTVYLYAEGYAVTASVGKYIQLRFSHSARGDGESWDAAYVTEDSGDLLTDGTQDQLDFFSWSETVSNLGWAAGDQVRIKVSRIAPAGTNLPLDWGMTHFRISIPRT